MHTKTDNNDKGRNNETLIKRNRLLGMRIQHEVLKDQRAEYGEQVIQKLAKELTDKYGRGFIKAIRR